MEKIVTDAMNTSEALEECAQLYQEVVKATESTDLNDEKSILNTMEKQREFNNTLCLAGSVKFW